MKITNIPDNQQSGDKYYHTYTNEIKASVNALYDGLDISLPYRDVYVAVGRELNMWKKHLVQNSLEDGDCQFCMITTNDAGTTNSKNKIDRYSITPEAAGTFTLNYAWYSKNLELVKTIAYSNALKIVANDSGTGTKQLLFIGDSLMAAQTIVTEVHNLITAGGGITPTFLGTQGTTGNKHEGYGGKDWAWFNSNLSPFWNAALSRVDFSNYMSVNGFTGNIDYAFFQLGINDVVQTTTSTYPVTNLATIVANAKAVIDRLLADYPTCKIIFGLEPIGGGQDGAVYSAYHLKRKMLQLFDAYYTEFTKSEYSGKLYISPNYLWVDPLYGYPTETVNRSARHTSVQVVRQTDCVHLSQSGYQQNADAFYSCLRYILSL